MVRGKYTGHHLTTADYFDKLVECILHEVLVPPPSHGHGYGKNWCVFRAECEIECVRGERFGDFQPLLGEMNDTCRSYY
jgi:hypothetical protein